MLDENSSGFEDDGSPAWNRSQEKNLGVFSVPLLENFSLEELYKRLMQHLKQVNILPIAELMWYLDQVQKINVNDHKTKWLLAKVKGTLRYILNERSDFSRRVSEGEIIIIERSTSEPDLNVMEIPEHPRYSSQPLGDQHLSPLLTNNNFVSNVSVPKQNSMETDHENYPEDLLGNNIVSLHRESQENYEILKRAIQDGDITAASVDVDGKEVHKLPASLGETSLETFYKVHHTLEENYKSLGPFVSQKPDDPDDCFNNLTISNSDLRKEFSSMRKEMHKWILELAEGLMNLQDSEPCTVQNVNTEDSIDREALPKIYCTEERLKQIREICLEYRKFFEERVRKDKNFQMAYDILRSCE